MDDFASATPTTPPPLATPWDQSSVQPQALPLTTNPNEIAQPTAEQSFAPIQPAPEPQHNEVKPVTYNFTSTGEITQEPLVRPKSYRTVSGLFKLLLLILLPLALTAGVVLFFHNRALATSYQADNNVVLSVPMKDTNWQDLGTVFEPIVSLHIRTLAGYEEWEFLLDSGAVISSLPREWAEKMGKDLAFMKRSTFKGFGGKTSFAYQGEMTILLAEKDKTVPVVFTEATGTKSLLGRKGFFENYSVFFNHKTKRIEIRE